MPQVIMVAVDVTVEMMTMMILMVVVVARGVVFVMTQVGQAEDE
jgi:hypothetical protein